MPVKKSLLVIAIIAFTRTLPLHAECVPTISVQVPATACKSGTATVGVIAVAGATYAWTVDGGQIVGDAAGDHITIVLSASAKATASVTLTSGDCVSHGSGVIALHDPFGVQVAAIPAVHAGEPVTVIWSYANGTPGQQTISGDFGTVVLAADVRNYTFTPQNSGSKQFVIDAAMKQSAPIVPLPSRQRAVAKSPAGASQCTLAHAAAPYKVGDCETPTVVIDAPASVTADTAFDVRVQHQPGAVATWTITNGFPATATGDQVTVTPASSGQVKVTVRLTRGACTDAADRTIDITAKEACDNPTASVTTDPSSCGFGLLNASFIGTPPFKGMWSDNVPFETSSTSIVRSITMPGTFSITHFQDATCAGSATGLAVIRQPPTAIISGKDNTACAGVDTATARFTGRPPFSGCWRDGDCFRTSETQITKLIKTAGLTTLAYGTDDTGCPMTIYGGVQTSVTQSVGLTKRCEWAPNFGNIAHLFVLYTGTSLGPAAVTWSDGVKTGTLRQGVNLSQPTTYTVTGISDSGVCTSMWDTPRSITIYPTPEPSLVPDTGDLCLGAIGTTKLAADPPPGTTVHWDVGYGTIISGQGTNSIQYVAGDPSPSIQMYITCTFIFADPNRCPLITRIERRVIHRAPFALLQFSEASGLQAGKTMLIQFTVGADATGWSLTDSMNDPLTPSGTCTPASGSCYWLYTSTHGGGNSTITLHVTNGCQTTDVSKVLLILP